MNNMENEHKCKEYQIKLGLKNEPIVFKFNTKIGGTSWNGKNWIIYYRNDFDILHELGHLLLNNNPKNYIHSHPTWIYSFINNIIDCFDNFNLITNPKIPEFASLLSDECYDYTTTLWNRISQSTPHKLLALFCLLFLNWNYIVPNTLKKNRTQNINFVLKQAKRAIFTEIFLSEEYFDDFKNRLAYFKAIKDKYNIKTISSYILNILVDTRLASKNTVLTVIRQLIS